MAKLYKLNFLALLLEEKPRNGIVNCIPVPLRGIGAICRTIQHLPDINAADSHRKQSRRSQHRVPAADVPGNFQSGVSHLLSLFPQGAILGIGNCQNPLSRRFGTAVLLFKHGLYYLKGCANLHGISRLGYNAHHRFLVFYFLKSLQVVIAAEVKAQKSHRDSPLEFRQSLYCCLCTEIRASYSQNHQQLRFIPDNIGNRQHPLQQLSPGGHWSLNPAGHWLTSRPEPVKSPSGLTSQSQYFAFFYSCFLCYYLYSHLLSSGAVTRHFLP